MTFQTEDLYRLALEAGVTDRTVRRWYNGRPVHKLTRKALLEAHGVTGIPVPDTQAAPEPSTGAAQ